MESENLPQFAFGYFKKTIGSPTPASRNVTVNLQSHQIVWLKKKFINSYLFTLKIVIVIKYLQPYSYYKLCKAL
jgi:hypothetical protein